VLSIPTAFEVDPNFWPRLGTWLRSTREARLTAREDQWKKKHKKKRIATDERTAIARSMPPTSLFDCFWRMRIKSNYGTIDPYLVSQISEGDHEAPPLRSSPQKRAKGSEGRPPPACSDPSRSVTSRAGRRGATDSG